MSSFLIRRATIQDVPTLLKLAKMVHFINLPADKDIIADKVVRSRECFLTAAESAEKAAGGVGAGRKPHGDAGLAKITGQAHLFLFTLEDVETGSVIGTSQVVSRMGGPGQPNVVFQLERREKFSTSLQSGSTQMVARLLLDESSPTEIGGLILQPSFRGHRQKLGRFLSMVRFHFIGLSRVLFSDRVVAEMMAPITPDGRNTLWEYLGRRFINLSYEEADRFCQFSKEFMISLLPHEPIYLSLLPPEARCVVGQVGPETVPARRMLESLGFQYLDRIDPFDGGPHLEAATDDISVVRQTERRRLGEPARASECNGHGIVSVLDTDGDFRAIEAAYRLEGTSRIRLTRVMMERLKVDTRADIGVTPLPPPRSQARGAARSTSRRKTAKRSARRSGKT